MRQTISGLIAAIAVLAASAAPAKACGWFAPCGGYVAATIYSGCSWGCGGWAYERLPDPIQQYYYAEQGPIYTGPGNFAPYRVYREGSVSGWGGYGRSYYPSPRYGYRVHPRRYY